MGTLLSGKLELTSENDKNEKFFLESKRLFLYLQTNVYIISNLI